MKSPVETAAFLKVFQTIKLTGKTRNTHFSQLGLLLSLGELFFKVRPDSNLAVHDARAVEIAQQIL